MFVFAAGLRALAKSASLFLNQNCPPELPSSAKTVVGGGMVCRPRYARIEPAARMQRIAANDVEDSTAESGPPRLPEASKPDLLTIAAIAIVATVIANFIHEGLGHGGMCVATGGRPLVLSTVHFECSADTRLVEVGGTLANLILGTLSWLAVRVVKQSAPWRYFFWLLMTFNLFHVGGYFLFSGIGNIGDWTAVVAGWQPAWAWRVGLAALGIVTYFFLFVPLSLRELRPFLGKDAKIRVRRARQLTLVPYRDRAPAVRL